MKNKKIIIIIIALVVVLIALGIWLFMPTTFLKNVDAKDVKEIEVFSGSTGVKFVIDDEESIKYIVENIQGITMKKEKLSVGYKGYKFSMEFKDEKGNIIESFILNGESTIRKDPFFYTTEDGGLCSEYISSLHNMQVMLDNTDGDNSEEENGSNIKARFIKTKSGTLFILDNIGPVEVNFNNAENKEEIERVINDLTDGDLVEINCGPVAESYPGKTNLYDIKKLEDGSLDDISSNTLDSLKELGWIE